MGISLNASQKAIGDEAIHFYKRSTKQVYEFGGYAGTGKSVVLNYIKQELGFSDNEIAPMAYIGQAAIVMRMKGFSTARTSHSWLYNPVIVEKKDKNGKTMLDPYFHRPVYEMKFVPKDLSGIKAIFIDEGYSLPEKLRPEIESRNLKIFVTGDSGQLPPVKDSPAYLKTPGTYPILTEIARQSENSGIIYLATRARQGLPIEVGDYGDAIVIEYSDLDLDSLYYADMVVCGTNNHKDIINKIYRKNILGYTDEIPHLNEKIICRKNNWTIDVGGINLTNGLRGTVMNNPDVSRFNGKTFKIDFKPDLINGVFENIDVDYQYFVGNNDQRQYLKGSPYQEGEKFEFAYASTCHLSQGSQYQNGIYIEDYLRGGIQNNLNYTGITRFANKLIYVKPSNRKNKPLKSSKIV